MNTQRTLFYDYFSLVLNSKFKIFKTTKWPFGFLKISTIKQPNKFLFTSSRESSF